MTSETPKRYWRVPLDASSITRLRGTVNVLEDRCKGCGFCVEFCPLGVLSISDRYNVKGYHPPDIVSPEACNACHLCELLCPEFAIGIEETEYKEMHDAR